MFKFLLKLAMSKPATAAYPDKAEAPERGLRGTPVLVADRCDLTADCQAACPTGVIAVQRDATAGDVWQIDYGSCIFCGICIQVCPEDAIVASDAFELAVRRREHAIVTQVTGVRDG